ncbi:ABC transporter substrate-binding protein [Paenibacillus sp. MBLB4367]|uniref:ABC transporter substrate-binding protein n=1 Tax=Paenibacillus sp. MBLB4367 TaxID=3384767 RepID=UPI003907E950
MRNNRKRTAAAGMAVLLSAAVAASGCGKSGGNAPADAKGSAAPSPAAESAKPAKKLEKLSYWVSMNANSAATMKSYSDLAAYKKLEEATGVKVDFKHPAGGQAGDQFNLMMTSNDMTDVIEYNWLNVPGGPEKYIKDGKIVKLNEYIDKYAPNFSKLLKDRPDLKKMISTDSGAIYVFPFLRGDDFLLTYMGTALRKDWLEQLKLDMPTTIDEWYAVLKAFKEKDPNKNGKPDEIPLLLNWGEWSTSNAFMGAWGVSSAFYQEDGKIKYGLLEPGFKEFIATLQKWYKEGLIDADYATTDAKLRDAKITGDRLGSFVTYTLGRHAQMMEGKHPTFALAAAPYPVLKKGDKPVLGQKDTAFSGIGAAITTSNKNIEETVKWLDYKYGQQGHMLFNFGVEGDSYKLDNGYPKFTDMVLKNPDGLPVAHALAKYALSNSSGPFLQDKRWIEQNAAAAPGGRESLDVWMKAENKKQLPPITPTPEESSQYASIMNDINTYKGEMLDKFVMGVEPMTGYDKFVSTIKSMGIDKAIQIQQAALDRYNKR